MCPHGTLLQVLRHRVGDPREVAHVAAPRAARCPESGAVASGDPWASPRGVHQGPDLPRTAFPAPTPRPPPRTLPCSLTCRTLAFAERLPRAHHPGLTTDRRGLGRRCPHLHHPDRTSAPYVRPDGPAVTLQAWANATSLGSHPDTSDLSWPQTPSRLRPELAD